MDARTVVRVDIDSYLSGTGYVKSYKDVKHFVMHDTYLEFIYDGMKIYLPTAYCEVRQYFA